jgi:hypothetical protein
MLPVVVVCPAEGVLAAKAEKNATAARAESVWRMAVRVMAISICEV